MFYVSVCICQNLASHTKRSKNKCDAGIFPLSLLNTVLIFCVILERPIIFYFNFRMVSGHSVTVSINAEDSRITNYRINLENSSISAKQRRHYLRKDAYYV